MPRYDNTPPRFQTDRHRGDPDLNKVKDVRPMSGARDAASARAGTYGANSSLAYRGPRGARGKSMSKKGAY